MADIKRTQVERREDSDSRIIASAIRHFGRYGYTHSKNTDIAKGAGVTAGLIVQRFAGKENLFVSAYRAALKDVFRTPAVDATPRACLCSIIEDIISLYDRDPDAFEFCVMLHNTTDYPKEALQEIQEGQKKTHSYAILADAQKAGMLPQGNLDELLASFGANVFNNVKLCRRYHVELPEMKVYLEAIHFVDEEVERDERWHRVLETAIANTFELLTYLDIRRNTGEMMKCSERFSVVEDTADIRESMWQFLRDNIPETDRGRVWAYFDPDTLSERIRGRKSLSLQFLSNRGTKYIHTFLPVSWDENGKLTEVFAGIYEVRE